MTSQEDWAVPRGSTVLVTGANGFLGSHIADQFLQHGFQVRGAVRDVSKNVWLADVLNQKHGKGRFELRGVPDMAAPGAFDDAAQGVSVVAHTASVMSLDPDPHKVVPGAVALVLNAARAAYAEPATKRFVFCSSSTAAVLFTTAAVPPEGIVVTEATWNEAAVREAWAEPPYTPDRFQAVYAASKVQAEQAVWRFAEEHASERPDLVVNTVLPNMTLGSPLDPVRQGYPSTAGMVALLYQGKIVDYHRNVPRQYFVDVQDVGRLHVAAAVLEKVRHRRLFAFAERYSWDSVLGVLRQLEPAHAFPDNFSGGEDPHEIEPRHYAEQLLRDLGRSGWTSLEESLRGMVEGLRENEGHEQ
ncbi:hypothetical protein PG985_001903 [Apiospora marii]|uniref:uncharacterized protein n=1 Tax=Apiospora marii TaxID=335849 RepID=UPI003131CADA